MLSACGGQRQRISLGRVLQVGMTCPMWMLGIELGFSALCVLNDFQPRPSFFFGPRKSASHSLLLPLLLSSSTQTGLSFLFVANADMSFPLAL